MPDAPDVPSAAANDSPARAAYLTGNHLPHRWRGAARFVILDTDFGDGLKFLTTWHAWRADPARAQKLHYLAIAHHPITGSDLEQAHAASDELSPLALTLCAQWPPAVSGFHRLLLGDESVVLTLMAGDIASCLAQITASVDVFYVDAQACSAHAPKILGRLAAAEATLVIVPASGEVQQNMQLDLQQAGFVREQPAGLAQAPAMYCARFAPRWPLPLPSAPAVRRAIVIGAGLAGSAACARLTARGWHVTLIERQPQPAQEASGNLAGIFMPVISKDDNPTSRLTRAAYLFAHQIWQRMGGIGAALTGEVCGALQLARDAEHAQTQQEAAERLQYPAGFAQWLDAAATAEYMGGDAKIEGKYGAWWFAQGGWANPATICRAMLVACGDKLETRYAVCAQRLERVADQWQVIDANGTVIAQAPTVILANGTSATQFEQAQALPLASVRGQVTYLPQEALPYVATVICGDAYVTPPSGGLCSVGATYDDDTDPLPRRASDAENCAKLRQIFPNISIDLDATPHQSRVGFRCVAPDRLPLAGALPDVMAANNVNTEQLRDVPRLPGLYGLLGYASRGLIWASLAAELLASQLEGEPLPLERDLLAALDPARFILQARRQGINR